MVSRLFKSPQGEECRSHLDGNGGADGLPFVGSIGLTQFLGVVAGPQETILSALARRLFGRQPPLLFDPVCHPGYPDCCCQYQFCRISHAWRPSWHGMDSCRANSAVLVTAWHLPMASFLLGSFTAVLIILFQGDTHALIPLFAIGAFLAFTLSQAGMVVHWWKERGQTVGAEVIHQWYWRTGDPDNADRGCHQ